MNSNLVIQLHPDVPVYQSPKDAARTLGIGRDTLEMYMSRLRDPLPHKKVGTHRKVCIPKAIEWLERH